MRLSLLACVSLLALAAAAQNPPPQMPLPPNHATEAQVRRLFSIMHVAQMQHQVMEGMVQQLPKLTTDALASRLPDMTEKDAEFVSSVVKDELKQFADPKIVALSLDAMVPVYEQNISAADMDKIIAFYSSPAGQRVLTAMPIMAQEANARMMPVLQGAVEKDHGRAGLQDRGLCGAAETGA